MWIFTENGFISAVRKSDNTDVLTVRARDAKSLAELAELTQQPIAKSPSGDYPYRIFVKPDALADWAKHQVELIDYNNFKNRVAVTRGYGFVSALHDVWSAMLAVEDDNAREKAEND